MHINILLSAVMLKEAAPQINHVHHGIYIAIHCVVEAIKHKNIHSFAVLIPC